MSAATIHASAVLAGATAVLVTGPSGSGKSRLVWDILRAARTGLLPFARLVADDRALVAPHHGRLLVRPAPALAGLLELRGFGIRRLAHEPVATVGLTVTLGGGAGKRLPEPDQSLEIDGIRLPVLACGDGADPLALVLAWLGRSQPGD